MRFVVTGEWRTNQVLRLVIALFLLFTLLFWLTNGLLFFDRMGFSITAITEHFLGKKTAWGAGVPRSYKVLLEISHAHLFAMGILVMTMTHLLLFVPASMGLKVQLVIVTFATALLDEGAGWLIRYVHPGFAYLKLIAFIGFQLALGAIIVLLAVALVRGRANGATYRGREPARRE